MGEEIVDVGNHKRGVIERRRGAELLETDWRLIGEILERWKMAYDLT